MTNAHPSRWLLAAAGLGLAALATACQPEDDATAGAAPQLVVRATDNDYPDPVEAKAGVAELVVDNQGQDLHQVALLKLEDGKTFDDYLAFAKTATETDPLPSWAVPAGGPAVAAPGQKASAFVDLEAGTYAMICRIPDAQGVPHDKTGMVKPLTVTAGDGAPAEAPAADVDLSLTDFAFALGGPVAAGRRVVAVANKGQQMHEAVLVKLDEGATAMDVAAAFAPGGSGRPPAMPLGGVVGLAGGAAQSFPVDFTPGRYALLCFLPDPASGKVHAELGMMSEFDVQ